MMMKTHLRNSLLLTAILLFSPCLHATQIPALSKWVKETLINTLSVNYKQQSSDFAEVRNNYSFNAWNGITGFLGGYVDIIRAQKLIIHPVLEGEPRVVTSGIFSGIHYWRVNQNVVLPELNIKIDFSLIIIARNPSGGSPFVIQSLNMQKNPF